MIRRPPRSTQSRSSAASDVYKRQVSYMGQTYANNEAAFQAQKTLSAREQRKFCIFRMHNPSDAKKLGRDLTLRPDWEKVKVRLMYEILSLIHISEPTRLGMISYAVFCLKKKKKNKRQRDRQKCPINKYNIQ